MAGPKGMTVERNYNSLQNHFPFMSMYLYKYDCCVSTFITSGYVFELESLPFIWMEVNKRT